MAVGAGFNPAVQCTVGVRKSDDIKHWLARNPCQSLRFVGGFESIRGCVSKVNRVEDEESTNDVEKRVGASWGTTNDSERIARTLTHDFRKIV
jgi:hypothetical protein